MPNLVKLIITVFITVIGVTAHAVPIFENNAVVGTATNSANFDSITLDTSLADYNEDGINVIVDDQSSGNFGAFGISSDGTAFHYGSSGNTSWVEISMRDGGLITELDFMIGHGWPGIATTNLIWETFNGTSSTGFGDIDLNIGSIVGWTDVDGFTSIRVAANQSGAGINAFGEFQAIAIDNLNVNAANVPEASSLMLLGFGLIGFGFVRRRS